MPLRPTNREVQGAALNLRLRLTGLLLLASLAGACAGATPTPTPTATPTAAPTPTRTLAPTRDPLDAGLATVVVEAGRGRFTAVVVDTPQVRARGLSGREALAPNRAMWFDMGAEAPFNFWMLGMRFPIDIVWVDADFEVVHVTHEAPVPPDGATEADLPRYSTGGVPIRYVLEINAGLARELGIEPGVRVTLTEP